MVLVLAVGDVAAARGDPATIFRGARRALRGGDVLFGQLEATVTDRGAKAPNARLAMRSPPTMARAARDAGFDVMSFAGNHCLDWGSEGFSDTLTHAGAAGIKLCGAGETLTEARRPAMIDAGGLRIAFLAYCSILPEGYRAGPTNPGAAPLRAHTFFEMAEPDQPGTAPHILTVPHAADLAALVDDVGAAKERADLVFVSMHWGLHMAEVSIADYQPVVAAAAIDAGANAILGHHPHLLKGVDFYKGAPIFYSLGNFAIDQPHLFDPAIMNSDSFRHFSSLHPGFQLDQLYVLPEATRLTGIARLTCSSSGVERAEFVPAWAMDDSAPEMLISSDPRFATVADYLQDISRRAGFTTEVTAGAVAIDLRPGRGAGARWAKTDGVRE